MKCSEFKVYTNLWLHLKNASQGACLQIRIHLNLQYFPSQNHFRWTKSAMDGLIDKNNSVYCDNGNTVQEIFEDSVDLESSERNSFAPKLFSAFCSVSKVTENLLLASAAATDADTLKYFNVTCIVNAAAELPDVRLTNNSVNYHKVSIYDLPSVDILSCFDSTLDIIEKEISNRGTVLIHCVAGISRSATICIAYLMKHHRMSLLQAYNHIKLKRPTIKPNCGFFRQLIQYEKLLYDHCTVHMIYNETVNMEIPDVYNCDYKNILDFRRKQKDSVRHH